MKKRTTKRTTTRKTNRHTHHTHSHSSQHVILPFSFRRIIFITTAVALFLAVAILFNKDKVTQSVAGIGVARGLFAEARVDVPKIEGAASYNIYYKEQSAGEYTNVARDIPASVASYLISYLKKGEEYIYKVAAVDASGAEFYWTTDEELTNIEPM
ncbi:MAG TPA: hypothetical protein VLF20_04690 [Patescibacteria group bacterium]|nr:hypothetical protein [Patescibacteria group bacterium]